VCQEKSQALKLLVGPKDVSPHPPQVRFDRRLCVYPQILPPALEPIEVKWTRSVSLASSLGLPKGLLSVTKETRIYLTHGADAGCGVSEAANAGGSHDKQEQLASHLHREKRPGPPPPTPSYPPSPPVPPSTTPSFRKSVKPCSANGTRTNLHFQEPIAQVLG